MVQKTLQYHSVNAVSSQSNRTDNNSTDDDNEVMSRNNSEAASLTSNDVVMEGFVTDETTETSECLVDMCLFGGQISPEVMEVTEENGDVDLFKSRDSSNVDSSSNS